MKRTLLTLAIVGLASCGCVKTELTTPEGARFARVAFMYQAKLSRLTLKTDTNGIPEVDLQSYSGQTDPAVVEAVARGVANGFAGQK